jgi:predicted HTH transcriptional regulator
MEEIQEKGKKIIISEKIVNAFSGYNLNTRQVKIIRYLVINDRIDNEQCQSLCNSIKRTATRDLTGLVGKSLLVKHGEKKGTSPTMTRMITMETPQIKQPVRCSSFQTRRR